MGWSGRWVIHGHRRFHLIMCSSRQINSNRNWIPMYSEEVCTIMHDAESHVIITVPMYLQVDIREEQFLVATMNDGGMVWAGKHIGCICRVKLLQNNWFCAQDDLLATTQVTCNAKRINIQNKSTHNYKNRCIYVTAQLLTAGPFINRSAGL